MRQQRRGESARETIVGIVVVLAIIAGAIWFFHEDKSGTTKAEQAAREAEQKVFAEKIERRRLDERDAGVLTTPPAWAKGVVPPPVEVDDLKRLLEVGEVLVRYRLPPGDTEECLEYYVEGVTKQPMRFSRTDPDGKVWIPVAPDDYIQVGGFVIRFIGHDGREVLPEKAHRFEGEVIEKGTRLAFDARLTADQLKAVRIVRFETTGSNGPVPLGGPGR